MFWTLCWLLLFFFETSAILICYNCSSTHRDWNQCGGDFVSSVFPFNNTRENFVNCTGENAMCFVRSWSARAHHAWIVQRGCYQVTVEDTLPRSMNAPTRAMSCKYERHPDAEYKVCLCQTDWCNSASTNVPSALQHFTKIPLHIIGYIIALRTSILRVLV